MMQHAFVINDSQLLDASSDWASRSPTQSPSDKRSQYNPRIKMQVSECNALAWPLLEWSPFCLLLSGSRWKGKFAAALVCVCASIKPTQTFSFFSFWNFRKIDFLKKKSLNYFSFSPLHFLLPIGSGQAKLSWGTVVAVFPSQPGAGRSGNWTDSLFSWDMPASFA